MTSPLSFFDLLTATQWISIAQVAATALVGLIAGVITWVMQSRQIDIAKGLKEIARGQHETAATKLRLELFEKRFAAYKKVILCLDDICDYKAPRDYQRILNLNKKYIDACTPFRYLFNSSIHDYLKKDVVEIIGGYIHHTNEDHDSSPAVVTPVSHTTSGYFFSLQDVYKKLDEMVSPFLQVEKEKPLIEQDNQS